MARLVLETQLSSEEVFRRLAAAADAWPLLNIKNVNEWFSARLRPPRFTLTRGAVYFFMPTGEVFTGRVVEEAGRTRIYGRLGLPLSVLTFLSVLIGFPTTTIVPKIGALPALDRFEILLPLCWVATFCLLRLVAWDYGGPEDRYATFLAETLRDPVTHPAAESRSSS